MYMERHQKIYCFFNIATETLGIGSKKNNIDQIRSSKEIRSCSKRHLLIRVEKSEAFFCLTLHKLLQSIWSFYQFQKLVLPYRFTFPLLYLRKN